MIEKIKVSSGVYWIGIPEADLYVLCGCPADSVKHLMKMGLIKTVERSGLSFETGPNAILLSDILVQRGSFSNLAEFPVLQMLYRQGMILPNHPNNKGEKPILIGMQKQIESQMEYIFNGNYGLSSVEEIAQTGISKKRAEEMMRLKLKFAFGQIRPTEDLIEPRAVGTDFVEIKNGVIIRRIGFNRYQLQYLRESVEVDLNLPDGEEYEPPYKLGFHQIKREYFAVIHSGEGDGWDINRPCMSSILVFHGKIYLIDAGPNILSSLTSLGISVNEIEGIFHTHAHDDHFSGLTTLIRSDHRIKYYTTPLVRASVSKKLSALISWDTDHLDRYFDIYDLELDEWNNIEGLEVKPTFSPHPVECNIFTFRAYWEDGYRTYAHFADIASVDVLKGMISEKASEPGLCHKLYDQVLSDYLAPANLKKIDIGGGMIHGKAVDFEDDESDKIILSHTALDLTVQEKGIGSSAPFGMMDILIPSNQDYTMRYAAQLLSVYFLDVPREDLRMLLNCNVVPFNAGSILIKEGNDNYFVYLILTGMVEMLQSDTGVNRMLSAGSLIGELSGILKAPSMETYRAASYIWALKMPGGLYHEFVKRNKLYRNIETVMDCRDFLQGTWLLGESVSYPIQNKIAQAAKLEMYQEGKRFRISGKPELFLLYQGEIQLLANNTVIEILRPGEFCGEESILYDTSKCFEIRVTKPSGIYHIPGDTISDIPIVQWKLLETLERRLKIFGGHLEDIKQME